MSRVARSAVALVALLLIDPVFAFVRQPLRAGQPLRMAVSAAPPIKTSTTRPNVPGWIVSAASMQNNVLHSLDAALQDMGGQSLSWASLALLRISVPYGSEPDSNLAAAVVQRAQSGLKMRDGVIVGFMTPMRDADEHVVRVSVGDFPDGTASVFHLAPGQMLDRQSQLLKTNEDKRLLLYPREDFLEYGMNNFLDSIYDSDPAAHPLGEPAWEEDVLFTADLATGELTVYKEGMLGVQLGAVNDLEKKWPWWQRSLVPMLRWLDR